MIKSLKFKNCINKIKKYEQRINKEGAKGPKGLPLMLINFKENRDIDYIKTTVNILNNKLDNCAVFGVLGDRLVVITDYDDIDLKEFIKEGLQND